MNAIMTAGSGFGGLTPASPAFADCGPRRIIRREPQPTGGVGFLGLMTILVGLCVAGIVVGAGVRDAVIALSCEQQVVASGPAFDCREPVALQ